MKAVRYIAERLRLHNFSRFAIFIPLILVLSLGAYNVDLFFEPNPTVSRIFLNPTHANPADPKERVTYVDGERRERCNVFDGKWIYDPEASPLYDAAQCPFLGEQVSCRRNGRPDSDYEKWTWEAKGCNITSSNIGRRMLEKLRDKRVVVIGDSLNRNQWESLVCILYSSLPSSSKSGHVKVDNGSYKAFRAKEYNCTVEFFWSPFLVQRVVSGNGGDTVLKLDELVESASEWKGADIMVFNTGHWWAHHGKYQSWDISRSKGNTMEIESESALGLAMETWSRWIDRNVDANKTRVFFRSISPEHKGKNWCYNQTQPITDASRFGRYTHRMTHVVESKLREMKTPVVYLNITELSEYRKDGHPSIYATKQGKSLVAKNEVRPESSSDCSHWCLPGVPDTWNSLLFALIPFGGI